MILEYLFSNTEKSKELTEYIPEKVFLEIRNIENSGLSIAVFSTSGENEESAKTLSIVDEYVINNFNCIPLTNEAAHYFNKSLFPHINEFERKLRKLLYLLSKLSDKTDGTENIKELELMDLGTIFELMFSDIHFIKKVKETANNKSWQFTKRELIQGLSEIEENPLWNRILGSNITPVLCDKFPLIKSYRNDVMHARNINAEKFKDAKKLFILVNNELSEAINSQLRIESKTIESEKSETSFNKMIKEAIDVKKAFTSYPSVIKQYKELQEFSGFSAAMAQYKESLESSGLSAVMAQYKESLESSGLSAVIAQYKESLESSGLFAAMAQYKESLESSGLSAVLAQYKESLESSGLSTAIARYKELLESVKTGE